MTEATTASDSRRDEREAREAQLFPVLPPDRVARIASAGRARDVRPGEVLVHPGDRQANLFVVRGGTLHVVRTGQGGEGLVAVLRAGMFTGELSELVMRAFILLRRLELIAQGAGDLVVLGSSWSQGTLRVREFLTRNGYPYTAVDLDRDEGVQEILDRFHVGAADVPVVICRGTVVLRNPTNQQLDVLVIEASSPGARLPPARASRTTWAFPPGSRGRSSPRAPTTRP